MPPQNPVDRTIVDVSALENLALRQQLAIMQRKTKRRRLTQADRAFWVALCSLWPDWHNALIIVKPQTVIGWHRKGFKLYCTCEQPQENRTSTDRCGAPNAHPSNRHREPDLGSASRSRRVAHARLRGRRSHGVALHAASAKAAITDLACVSPEPHPSSRFH